MRFRKKYESNMFTCCDPEIDYCPTKAS